MMEYGRVDIYSWIHMVSHATPKRIKSPPTCGPRACYDADLKLERAKKPADAGAPEGSSLTEPRA